MGMTEILWHEHKKENGMQLFLLSELRQLGRAKKSQEKGTEEIQDSGVRPGLIEMPQTAYFI